MNPIGDVYYVDGEALEMLEKLNSFENKIWVNWKIQRE